ncbi:MAG TPA: site-2 protease family protein [Thermotogota bacterium]|nr:site-2 protease family protein [Thermotogota bacterium]
MFTNPRQLLLSIPAIFLAIIFHELAHALAADKLGDPTPRSYGRLTLNPLAHMDLFGLIAFLLIGFGWAKPVPINPNNFRNPKRDNILVSISGPAANLLIALITLSVEVIFLKFFPGVYNTLPGLIPVFHTIAYLNIAFAILNLLPIPPLDGYHIVKELIGNHFANAFLLYERYSLIVFFVALFVIFPYVFSSAQTVFFFLIRLFV